jgi:hypothetical protein
VQSAHLQPLGLVDAQRAVLAVGQQADARSRQMRRGSPANSLCPSRAVYVRQHQDHRTSPALLLLSQGTPSPENNQPQPAYQSTSLCTTEQHPT